MIKDILKTDEKYFKSLLKTLDDKIVDLHSIYTDQGPKSIRSAYSSIHLNYTSSYFTELLVQEDYIEDAEDAKTIMRLVCAGVLEEFYHPLLEKRLNEKILLINSYLKNIKITKKDILGDNYEQKYTETRFIIKGLTYENLSPFVLFEDFISFFSIRLYVDKDTRLFHYCFTRDTPIKPFEEHFEEWYTAKTIHEICEHFHNTLLAGVLSSIKRDIDLKSVPIMIDLKEYIDSKYIRSCKTAREVYNYLEKIEVARMALPLYYLYLLLNYKKFTIFKDTDVMNFIIEALIKEEPEPNLKNGYEYTLIRKIFTDISLNIK